MNTKRISTVTLKPTIATDPEKVAEWIANDQVKTSENLSQTINDIKSKQVDNKTSLPVNKNTNQQEDTEPTAMLSARVPTVLIRKLRIKAATEEKRIQDIMTELLRDYLETE